MDSTRFKKAAIAVILLIFSVVAYFLRQDVLRPEEGELHVWVLDVGQGDSILIDDGEYQLLVDGGPDDLVVERLGQILPVWDREIDYILNTHPHADHVRGLIDVQDYYLVGEVFRAPQEYSSQTYKKFLEVYEAEELRAGDDLGWEGLGKIEVLWPIEGIEGKLEDPNAGSVVLLVSVGENDMLLTGDIGVEEEAQIIELYNLAGIEVVKVGHQGSFTSSSREFLEKVGAKVGVISVGENSYGHPHQVILNRLAEFGVKIFRTDLHGSVLVELSEEGFDVETGLLR